VERDREDPSAGGLSRPPLPGDLSLSAESPPLLPRDPKRTNAQLVTADRMASMGMLAAAVAHELNNPLGVTIANVSFALEALRALDADLTADEGDGHGEMAARLARARAGVAGIVDALDEAWQSGDRARLIVRDLRTFSRVDDDRHVALEVRRVVESSINMAYNEIRPRARLVKEYGPIPAVLGNEARLGQVFFNLLVNAAHAIAEGDAEHQVIRVVTRTDDLPREDGKPGRCVVEISDTGQGIAPENLGRIFEPFFTTKRKNSTGLGLSICQSIITAMGGEITVRTTIGKGSTFRVSLPGSSEQARRPATTLAPGPTAPAARHRLLVIDDEPMMARAVQRLLDGEHEVTATSDPVAAVSQVRAGVRFDAILCDLMMPSMSGMEVYDAIAQIEVDQARRMVFMTGGAFTPLAVHFLESIENPRIEKPLEHDALRALLRKHLSDRDAH
jgi:signal transduction histidine kinase/ActR/RegA family two-component response regulator